MIHIEVMCFIPSKNIANLVTIITIYIGAAVSYFSAGTPEMLYAIIISLSIFIWIVALFVLHMTCKKIDVKPLKAAWEQLKTNDELFSYINGLFEKLEKLVRESVFFHKSEKNEVP